MSYIIQIIGAYIATVSAGLCVESPRALLFKSGYVGAVGYTVYLLAIAHHNAVIATLLAGIAIAIMSQIFARTFKAPVTLFYIPGFFPLVPGIGIYRTAFHYIHGENDIASQYFMQTLMIASAIALSIYLVDSLLEIYSHMTTKKT